MATGELPFPVCRKLIDSLRYIGNATDIFVPETHGLSVELKDFIEHWYASLTQPEEGSGTTT